MDQTQVVLTHTGSPASDAILEILPESGLAPDSLVLLGDESSIGTRRDFGGGFVEVLDPSEFSFSESALVLMPEYDADIESAVENLDALLVSHQIQSDYPAVYAPNRNADIQVSYTQPSVRLASPEICCLLGVLPTLHEKFQIKGINLVFLQPAESKGKVAIDELASQTVALLNGREALSSAYPVQISFNTVPADPFSSLDADLPKLIGNSEIYCAHQVVDVPVFHGLTISVQLEFANYADLGACEQLLKGIDRVDIKNAGASPITDCNQSFSCVISRLQQGQNSPRRIQFWMIADMMRYGLARNYLNVSDILLNSFL